MHLNTEQQKIVRRILHDVLPGSHVAVFGSRAKETKKKFSDLDLLIRAERPLSLKTLGQLQEEFTESSLPFRVDIVDAWNVSKEFLDAISSDIIVIQEE